MGFFQKLGFAFNPKFTDDKAACMVLSEEGYVMLLREEFFKTFTRRPVGDFAERTSAIVAFSVDSREAVDEGRREGQPPPAPPPRWTRRTTASCTSRASTTSTATTGRSSGWTRPPRRADPAAGALYATQ